MENNLITSHVEPQDEAFDTFRALFPLFCSDVSGDGLRMAYTGKPEFMNGMARIAQTIIIVNRLPLEVKTVRTGIVVEFVGADCPLECY